MIVVAPTLLYAHARLERTDPPGNSRLTRVPRELRLTFTEAPEVAVSSIALIGADSQAVALGEIRASAESSRVLVAPVLGPMREGPYLVRWRTATADGHPLSGTFTFFIERGAEGLMTPSTSDSPRQATPLDTAPVAPPVEASHDTARSVGYVIIRWVTLASLVLSLAAPIFVLLVLPRSWTAGDDLSRVVVPVTRERVRRLGFVASATLLLTEVARLSAQSIALNGLTGAMDPSRLGALLGRTVWGQAWLVQTVAAMALLVTLVVARRRPTAWKLALLLCVPLAASASLSGHAASSKTGVLLAASLDAVHILGAAAWLGGLAMIVLAAMPALPAMSAPRAPALSALVNAFSPVALACGALVVLSGVVAAALNFNSPNELFATDYGRVLVIKVALVSIALGAGAYNWRRVRPALERGAGVDSLHRSGSLELAASVVILLVTAILIATPPPR